MNIFYLDANPRQAAKWHVDKHVVKMPLEACQMLCTAHRVLDGAEYTEKTSNGRRIKRWKHPNKFYDDLLYKATHVKHPSCVWVRESNEHYKWLYEYFIALCNEYTQRYNKPYRCFEVFSDYLYHAPASIPSRGFSEPPMAMDSAYVVSGDVVGSYRQYYRIGKSALHEWKQNRPDWL